MSIAVTSTPKYLIDATPGQYIRCILLSVTGLNSSGNNSVPHGLKNAQGQKAVPLTVGLEPTSSNNFYEYQAADSTNVYVATSGSGSGTTTQIYLEG